MKFTKNRTLVLVILIASLFTTKNINAQGFTPPAEGNAAIYFIRVSGYAGSVSFEYFHNEKFIGIFKGKNYMRFEVPSGKHLFWASSEDKEFLDCSLKAGETYLVLVNIEMGAWKARVGLEPILIDNEDFERVKALVIKQAPVVTSQKKIETTQNKLDERGFVENIMERYETEWKYEKNTQQITEDMFIPIEYLH
jgi:hypothetical protein